MPSLSPATACTSNYIWIECRDYELGKGSFGSVYQGKDRNTGKQVAVKVPVRGRMRDSYSSLQREVDLLLTLDNDHIIKCITTEDVLDRFNRATTRTAIIMELGDGSLSGELSKSENYYGLPYRTVFIIIDHLVLALAYLDEKGIAHRDIKSGNVLIFRKPSLMFKLCDFGLSRIVDDPNQEMNSIVGAPGYLCEQTAGNAAMNNTVLKYTKDDCDRWSFACTVFECTTGRLPFRTARPQDYSGMYQMLRERPQDVICGDMDSNTGKLIWSKELPKKGRFYPRSLQNAFTIFFRRLFESGSSALPFKRYSELCRELISLKSFEYSDVNSCCNNEFFNTSSSVSFDKNSLDEELQILPSKRLQLRILQQPGGTASLDAASALSNSSENSETVIFALDVVDASRYAIPTVQLSAKPERFSCASAERSLVTLDGIRRVNADIFEMERLTVEKEDFVNGLNEFCHSYVDALEGRLRSLSSKLDSTNIINEAVRMQCTALCTIRPEVERQGLENNSKRVHQEVTANQNNVAKLVDELKETKALLEQVKVFPKRLSQRECLNATFAEMVQFSDAGYQPLYATNCQLLLRLFREAATAYKETSQAVRLTMIDHVHRILMKLYNLSVRLLNLESQAIETGQLATVAYETNEFRFNYLAGKNDGEHKLKAAQMLARLKEIARQRVLDAERELNESMQVCSCVGRDSCDSGIKLLSEASIAPSE